MDDKHFKTIVTAHKMDIADEGFSERVIRQLPERRNMLPRIVMMTFILIGIAFIFAVQGITPLLEQIGSLIASISRLQAPSTGAIVTYIGVLSIIGAIGYGVAQADAG